MVCASAALNGPTSITPSIILDSIQLHFVHPLRRGLQERKVRRVFESPLYERECFRIFFSNPGESFFGSPKSFFPNEKIMIDKRGLKFRPPIKALYVIHSTALKLLLCPDFRHINFKLRVGFKRF